MFAFQKCESVITQSVLENLTHFMEMAVDDSLRLVLDVLKQIMTVCPRTIDANEESVVNMLLEKWSKCSSDPLAHVHFLEVFGAACSSNSRLRESLYHYLVPLIMKSLSDSVDKGVSNHQVDYHRLGISLDLYSLLLRVDSSKSVPDSLWNGFPLVMLVRRD